METAVLTSTREVDTIVVRIARKTTRAKLVWVFSRHVAERGAIGPRQAHAYFLVSGLEEAGDRARRL
jgi:hypothetical protein